MADKKITQLNPIVVASSSFLLPIVDTTVPETKRISFGNIFASPGAIGTLNPNTAIFTNLTLSTGATINKFTTDTTLSGNSDTAVPTEKAVRTYVESKIHGMIFNPSDYKSIVYIDTTGGLEVDKDNFYWNNIEKSLNVKGNLSVGDDALPVESITKSSGLSISKSLNDPSSIPSYIGITNSIISDSTSDVIGNYTFINRDSSSGGMVGSYLVIANNSPSFNSTIEANKIHVLNYNGSPTDILGQEISLLLNPSDVQGYVNGLKVNVQLLQTNVSLDVAGLDLDLSCGLTPPLTNISGNAYAIKLKSIPQQFVSGTSYGLYIENNSMEYAIFVSDSTSKVRFEGFLETNSLKSNSIVLQTGATINEFSIDGTLSGNSDLVVPTEKAVKTYVDNAIGSITVTVDKIYKGLTSVQALDDTGFSGIVFKTRDYILGDSTGTITSTFRYNGYSSSNFTNPGNMIDGSLLTYATAGPVAGVYTQINNSNTVSDSTAVGTIIKVELRVYANTGVGIGEMILYPLFGGSNYGNSIDFYGTNGWSPYFDITNDPQSPLDWTWQDLKNLSVQVEVKVNSPGGDSTNIVRIRQIELKVTYANQSLIEGSKEIANFDKQGLILEYGVRINKFSSDGTLVENSNSTVPTERAIKTYVDNAISALDLLKVRVVSYDSTATAGEAIIVDATSDIVVHVVPKMDGKYVIKNASNYKVTIIPTFGTIDKQSLYILDVPMKSVTILSNGASLFIV